MIAKLTPAQIFDFERVLEACENSSTDQERDRRIEAVADSTVRGLLALALKEPLSARNLRAGMRLGEYELAERLGGGGFAEVWSAKNAGNKSAHAAIKIVRSEHLSGEGAAAFLQLFTGEIEHYRKLVHPDIIKLLEAGSVTLPGSASATPYLVMELWNGLPLPDACRGRSIEEKIRCFARICDAVQHAHRRGLMHLDLKPENILVKDNGGRLEPKLLDFGIARRFHADRPFDQARFGAGTLAYKAPEQIEPSLGGEDFRTDVHALGVLLFQLLTDRLPYPVKDGTPDEYRHLIVQGPRLPLGLFEASAGAELEGICNRAVTVERSERYDSPARLASVLRRWLRRRTGAWRRIAIAGGFLVAAAAVAAELSAHRQKPIQWKPFPIHWAGENSDAKIVWRDICWQGTNGWLCGWRNEQSQNPGLWIGEGILLHTSDGGKHWTDVPRTNFTMDRGTISCFEEKTWNGVGPLNSVDIFTETKIDGQRVTNGWIAGMTGVYSSTNAGSDDARWTRATPPPDGPDCYSFFNGLFQVDQYQEVYAFGWQGIAYWEQGGQWMVQFKTHTFAIASLLVADRSYRDAWAVSGGGGVPQSRWGAFTDHGAVFHYAWPNTNWERVDIPGLSLQPGQGLSQIGARRAREMFIIGSDGLIVRGTLNSTNWVWKKVRSNTSKSLCRFASDPHADLWAVGDDGTILTSTDGESWKVHPCFDDRGSRIRDQFTQIRFFGRQGWILGGSTVLRCDMP